MDMNKVLLSVLSAVAGAAVGASTVGRLSADANTRIEKMSDKHLALFLLMNQWVSVKQKGRNLSTYFEKNGHKRIAIYGMSYAGERLLEELRSSNIEVAYGIDKKAEGVFSEISILSPDDILEDVDAVVVTPIFFFDELAESLSSKLSCPILSLEDILYEV